MIVQARRAVLAVLAATLAAVTWLPRTPSRGTVLPGAPPLTHVPGAGEDVLLAEVAPVTEGLRPPAPPPDEALRRGIGLVVNGVGSPAQRAALTSAGLGPDGFRSRHEERVHANLLRAEVARDAAGLVEALGLARVDAFLAAREDLSRRYAEGAAWDMLAEPAAPALRSAP
jgi:hypothetical protein